MHNNGEDLMHGVVVFEYRLYLEMGADICDKCGVVDLFPITVLSLNQN